MCKYMDYINRGELVSIFKNLNFLVLQYWNMLQLDLVLKLYYMLCYFNKQWFMNEKTSFEVDAIYVYLGCLPATS